MNLLSNDYCLYCYQEIPSKFTWTSFFRGEKEKTLCNQCRSRLQWIEGETCDTCNRPLTHLPDKWIINEKCKDCVFWERSDKWSNVLTKNESIYIYNDFFKELLAKFKYRGDYALAKIFAEDIRKKLSALTFDIIVPIPLSEERLYERGFNQTESLLEEAEIPYTPMLKRIHTEKQSKKNRIERLKLSNVFQLIEPPPILLNKSILLFDDIYTTGTTVRQAALLLKTYGATTVSSFTLCRGV